MLLFPALIVKVVFSTEIFINELCLQKWFFHSSPPTFIFQVCTCFTKKIWMLQKKYACHHSFWFPRSMSLDSSLRHTYFPGVKHCKCITFCRSYYCLKASFFKCTSRNSLWKWIILENHFKMKKTYLKSWLLKNWYYLNRPFSRKVSSSWKDVCKLQV